MRSIFRKILWRIGRIVFLFYLGLGIFGWVGSGLLIFRPQPASYRADLAGLYEVKADDGTSLAVLHLPNPEARHTLFFFHGNAEDLGDSSYLLKEWQVAGFSIIAFDYRGYGLSRGQATESNVYSDTETVFADAQKRFGLRPEDTIVVGRSVGSGPAVNFAMQQKLAGLILISPFKSSFRVITHVKIYPFDRFDNMAKIGRVGVPILIFQGTQDEVIPFSHGQKLFATASKPKRAVWIEKAGHNDIFEVAGARIVREMLEFEKSLPVAPNALSASTDGGKGRGN